MTSLPRQGAALIGRRIGIALFWCMAVFVIGASAHSVVQELFDIPSAPAMDAEAPRCAASLRALHQALLDDASKEIRLPRDNARLRRWLGAWDRRYAETAALCGSLKDTRRTLLGLRERVEAMLHGYARDEWPLTERIERALQRFSPRSTPPRET
jgi:uncharacterized membrane protein